MAQKLLPEPPREIASQNAVLFSWLVKLYKRITDQFQLVWDQIDKTGSSISDLADSSHASLSDLTADDHTQYHNDTRGDARYYTQTQLDAGALDGRYYTETESNANLAAHTSSSSVHGVTGNVIGSGDIATTATTGVVLQGAAVADLSQTISGTYTQSEVQDISDKVDALLGSLRSAGIINT